jgi:hypothetical protein
MTDLDIDELLRILPQLIRENDTVKGAIISALSGVVATHEDIERVIAANHEDIERIIERQEQEMVDLNAKMDQRFEAQHQELVDLNAKSDQRFEALHQELVDSNAKSDQRFEALHQELVDSNAKSDQRFEALHQEIVDSNVKIDQRFDSIEHTLNQIQSEIGKPFEQFARNVVIRILEGEGFRGVRLKSVYIPDPEFIVSENNSEFEVDGLSEDPPIIVEITSILKDQFKIEKFLKKKRFLEDLHQVQYRGFFVASGSELSQEDKADIVILLQQNNCELINL